MVEPSSPLIMAYAKQVRVKQPDCDPKALQWAVMQKLQSKDLKVAVKVRAILHLSELEEATENAPRVANRSVSNMNDFIPNSSVKFCESLAKRRDESLEDIDAGPVLVSSFEEEVSSSQGSSTFFEGDISTAHGISPILIKKSPTLEDAHAGLGDRRSALLLDEKENDVKCSICPIC